MATIHAVYANGMFRPTDPVELPENCEVEIAVRAVKAAVGETTLGRLAAIAGEYPENPGLPPDLAAQHDHYLYGTPKRP